jgi:cell division septation protein DedD
VSESPRQSYYEIALTNRQVLSVFVVLLVSVLTAFLAGVWLGRRAAGPAVETVEAQTITSGAEPTEEPLERLEFFSRDQTGEGTAEESAQGGDQLPDQPAAQARAEPQAQEVAQEADPAPVEPPEPEVAQAEGGSQDQPSGLIAAPEPSEPEPAATVAESTPPAAERPEAAPAAPTGGTLVVQVFSSNNQVQAQGVVDQLRSGGFPALLSPVEVSGRTMYRVRIGPYADRQVAEGVAEQVRREYRLETWITE